MRMGFTTEPRELHGTRFATDAAKRQAIPIFHVNGEHMEAVVRVGRLALEYRQTFNSDVLVDLIEYRRHGHSEVDDPTVTHPVLYEAIRKRPPLWWIYAEEIGVDATDRALAIRVALQSAQAETASMTVRPSLSSQPDYWRRYRGGCYRPEYDVDTGVPTRSLEGLSEMLARRPNGFRVHPKIDRQLQHRLEMTAGKRPVDFGMAETLAFATLLKQGVSVRLVGQDKQAWHFQPTTRGSG